MLSHDSTTTRVKSKNCLSLADMDEANNRSRKLLKVTHDYSEILQMTDIVKSTSNDEIVLIPDRTKDYIFPDANTVMDHSFRFADYTITTILKQFKYQYVPMAFFLHKTQSPTTYLRLLQFIPRPTRILGPYNPALAEILPSYCMDCHYLLESARQWLDKNDLFDYAGKATKWLYLLWESDSETAFQRNKLAFLLYWDSKCRKFKEYFEEQWLSDLKWAPFASKSSYPSATMGTIESWKRSAQIALMCSTSLPELIQAMDKHNQDFFQMALRETPNFMDYRLFFDKCGKLVKGIRSAPLKLPTVKSLQLGAKKSNKCEKCEKPGNKECTMGRCKACCAEDYTKLCVNFDHAEEKLRKRVPGYYAMVIHALKNQQPLYIEYGGEVKRSVIPIEWIDGLSSFEGMSFDGKQFGKERFFTKLISKCQKDPF